LAARQHPAASVLGLHRPANRETDLKVVPVSVRFVKVVVKQNRLASNVWTRLLVQRAQTAGDLLIASSEPDRGYEDVVDLLCAYPFW
jgi:hypothetical protein